MSTPVVHSELWEFVCLVWREGDVREVRIPRHNQFGHTASGYFSDPARLADAVTSWDGQAANVYITLNPVLRALLSRAAERIRSKAEHTTSDADVVERRWLMLDIDPVRPAGISSTDAELAAAHEVAERATSFLGAAGWPDPLVVMSGNGYQILYRVDLPNDAASLALVQTVLDVVAAHCDTAAVHIDRSVANAARLAALVGTRKVKGDALTDRPHRLVRLERTPSVLSAVPPSCLEDVARLAQPKDASLGGTQATPRTRLADLLAAIGIESRVQPPDSAGIVWYGLEHCPFHSDGRPYECGVGEAPDGRFTGKCFHPEGAGKGWQEFKAALGLVPRITQMEPSGSTPAGAWPDELDPVALYGLPGDIVRALEPYSEADPVALLMHTLVGAGAAVGPQCYALAGDARHPGRLFATLVGETSRGRKGSAQHPTERLLRLADSSFAASVEGLSSGEGLIWAVRDPIEKVGRGADRHPEIVVIDPGVADKRLLVVETEFSAPLRIAVRDGNTLIATLRRAWDGRELRTLTKVSPAVATGAHICLVGHITRDELLRCLDRTDLGNGFANRFLWPLVRRSKLLPDGEAVPQHVIEPLARRLAEVVRWAAEERVLRRDDEASEVWRSVYGALTAGRAGLLGSVLSRAEAQVLRLSVLYAVLDMSTHISAEHLLAALAVWKYAEVSAEIIFGDAVGDPVADAILAALRRQGELTRTDIGNLLGRHPDRRRVDVALNALLQGGLAVSEVNRDTGGRPQEIWRPLFSHISLSAQPGAVQ